MTNGNIFTRWSWRKHQGLNGCGPSTLPWGLIKHLGVKRSRVVPERQLRHRGEHPHATGPRRWGRKEEPQRNGCKTQHVHQER